MVMVYCPSQHDTISGNGLLFTPKMLPYMVVAVPTVEAQGINIYVNSFYYCVHAQGVAIYFSSLMLNVLLYMVIDSTVQSKYVTR